MSDHAHRIMQDIKMEDSLIAHDLEQQKLDVLAGEALLSPSAAQEILAEHAHHQAQAIKEGMPYIPDDDCDNPLSL